MKRITPIVLVCLTVALFYFAIHGSHGYFRLLQTQREGLALERKSASLDKEIRELRRQIRAIGEDPLELEHQAREDLGLAKTGETLYVLPSRESAPQRLSPVSPAANAGGVKAGAANAGRARMESSSIASNDGRTKRGASEQEADRTGAGSTESGYSKAGHTESGRTESGRRRANEKLRRPPPVDEAGDW